MPTHPVTRAASFDSTIPFQLMLTLSTSTPPSTIALPRQYKEEANFPCQPESIPDIKVSPADPENGTGEVANRR
jgi:hypothetical protein